MNQRQKEIIDIIQDIGNASISDIMEHLEIKVSIATLNRDLAFLVDNKYLEKHGAGRGIYYIISSYYKIIKPISLDSYFDIELDYRDGKLGFDFQIFELLDEVEIFTASEAGFLEDLRAEYQTNIADISTTLYQKELERLTIEFSWKSSQIEGSTYSLLETEHLFKEKELAINKSREWAIMLLNHKEALNYILDNKDICNNLSLGALEEIHKLLVMDLGVQANIRSRAVSITGTTYKPLDNMHQIEENLKNMCNIINSKSNSFEKALLALLLISYIQPFEDGNKRTARMVANSLLVGYNACPLSYRNVDAVEYKQAMILFYEQNNINAFKRIFLQQVAFAVKNYFA